MIIIGIDPGKQGAIAKFSHDGALVLVEKFPDTTIDFKDNIEGVDLDYGVHHVYCEHAQKHTPGRLALASVWRSHGIIEGVCAGLGVSLIFVNPTEWKKTVLAGLDWKKNKECSETYVRRKYPNLELPKNKQLRSGYCDAICIAEYGLLRNR